MIMLNFDFGKRGMHFESASTDEGTVGIYNAIGDLPFELLGIDAKKIRESVRAIRADGLDDAIAQLKIGEIVKTANGGEFVRLCEPLIFDELVRKYVGEVVPYRAVATSTPKFKGKLMFISDSKDWVIIKKMSVAPETTPREVAAFLLGVKAAVLSKYLSLKFPNRGVDAAAMEKTLKGKRKSLGALVDVWKASGNGRNICAFLEGAAQIGYQITPSQDLIKETFPELKLPGIRGRKAKEKVNK